MGSEFDPSDAFGAQYEAAVARGEARRKTHPLAASVEFEAGRGEYVIRLTSGESFGIPIAKIPELLGARPGELSRVEIFARGEGVRWDALDLDLSTLTLLNRAFGQMIRRAQRKKSGEVRSVAKTGT